jgi:hypothetical protein
MAYASKAEFGADVRRAQRGDDAAQARLRAWADRARDHRGATVRDGRAVAETRTTTSRRQRSQLTVPPKDRFIRSAILEVIDLLGIKRPVQIRWADAVNMCAPKPGYRMNGEHEFTAQGTHIIKLLPGRSAEATSRTLLHELAHAAQAETCGTRARWARAKLDSVRRFEAEAAELARALGHLKLVK